MTIFARDCQKAGYPSQHLALPHLSDHNGWVSRFKETGDPAIVIGEVGKGKVLVYTSDPSPHWGCNFVYWDGYPAFWQSLAKSVME